MKEKLHCLGILCLREIKDIWRDFYGWLHEEMPLIWKTAVWILRTIDQLWWLCVILVLLAIPALMRYWEWISVETMLGFYKDIPIIYIALYAITWATHELDLTRLGRRKEEIQNVMNGDNRIENAHLLAELSNKIVYSPPSLFSFHLIFSTHLRPSILGKKKGTLEPAQEMVISILKSHKEWKNAHFGELNLSNQKITYINFNKSCIDGGNFFNAAFRDVSFEETEIANSNFNNVSFSEPSTFNNVAFIGVQLREANFFLALANDACFAHCDMRKASFGAGFTHARFYYSNLEEANIATVHAFISNIQLAEFNDAIFYRTYMPKLCVRRYTGFRRTENPEIGKPFELIPETDFIDDKCENTELIQLCANVFEVTQSLYQSLLPKPVHDELIRRGKGYLFEEEPRDDFFQEGYPKDRIWLHDIPGIKSALSS